MKVKASWTKKGTEFRLPYPKIVFKIAEYPDGTPIEKIKEDAREVFMLGFYLRSVEILEADDEN
jgi:hypothetical protein